MFVLWKTNSEGITGPCCAASHVTQVFGACGCLGLLPGAAERDASAPVLLLPFGLVLCAGCVDIPRKTQDGGKGGINLKRQEQSFTRRVGLVFLLMTFQYVCYAFHCSYWVFSGGTHPHTHT